jgi:hypothetical protein
MRRLFVGLLAVTFAAASLSIGCRDENDPGYWLKQMHNRPWREHSLKTLNTIFSKTMQENGNDLKNPKVKALTDLMVPELVKGYQSFDRDKFNRATIIEMLAQMKDPRAEEVYLSALEIEESVDAKTFTVAANAVRRLRTEAAVPKLLEAHKKIVEARNRRPGAPFTVTENEIEQSVISAASAIMANHPASPHRAAVVKMLCDITETWDTLQDLRLNMRAIKGLGMIGDAGAIPTLVKGVAMKGKRQPVGLGQVAVAALQEIEDRDAVVEAMIQFAQGKDGAFNEYYAEERKNDPLMKNPAWYYQEAMNFLGQLQYPSAKVIEFLTQELNHTEPDGADNGAASIEGLAVQLDASGWATMRRNWAAVALASLGHKDVLDVAVRRIVFKKQGNKQVLDLLPEEAVGYIRALGLLQYPTQSCGVLRKAASAADDSLRDKVYYNASLMCDESFLPSMQQSVDAIDCQKILAERFPDGAEPEDEKQTLNECDILKKRIEGYMDRIRFGKECGDDLACFEKVLAEKTNPNTERAIYTLYRMARDDESKRQAIVDMLIKYLDNPAMSSMQASIQALDHLVKKPDQEMIKKVDKVYRNFTRQSSYKDRARALEAFRGRLRARSKA